MGQTICLYIAEPAAKPGHPPSPCLSCPLSLIELFFLCIVRVRRSINRRRFSALTGNPEHSDEMGIMRALMYNQQSTGPSHLPVPPPPCTTTTTAWLQDWEWGCRQAGVGCWFLVLPFASGVTELGRTDPGGWWIPIRAGVSVAGAGMSPNPKRFLSILGHQGSSRDGPSPAPPSSLELCSGHSLAFWLPQALPSIQGPAVHLLTWGEPS